MEKISKMNTALLITALTSFVSANAAMALDGKVFPGKGSKEIWLQASRIGNDGNALANAKKHDAAVAKFQQSIAMYPYADASYRNLGVLFEERAKPGDLQKAESAYRKACSLDPKDWQNWNALANVLVDENKLADAKQAFQTALEKKPEPGTADQIRKSIGWLDEQLTARK